MDLKNSGSLYAVN